MSAELFATDVTRPETGPVAYTDSPPLRQRGSETVRIDPARHAAAVDGHELDLTYLEFALLEHLVPYPRRVHSREQPMVGTRGCDHIGESPDTRSCHRP